VAMVHSNNCTSDLNAWVEVFGQFAAAIGAPVERGRLFEVLLGAAADAGLGRCLRAEHGVARRINDLEALAHLEPSAGAEPALAGPVEAWARGAGLARVLEDSDLTAGDFVRWAKQLLDVLAQLASLVPEPQAPRELRERVTALSAAAADASLDVSRGVVAWSGV